MKEMTLELIEEGARRLFEEAQQERILVTRDGEPYAIVVGIQYKDEEDLALVSDPEFWRMIEERRGEPTIPLAEVEARLFGDQPQEEQS